MLSPSSSDRQADKLGLTTGWWLMMNMPLKQPRCGAGTRGGGAGGCLLALSRGGVLVKVRGAGPIEAFFPNCDKMVGVLLLHKGAHILNPGLHVIKNMSCLQVST